MPRYAVIRRAAEVSRVAETSRFRAGLRDASRVISEHRAAWIDDDAPLLPSLTVEERKPRYTGILDKHGNEYVEIPEPIGFITKEN